MTVALDYSCEASLLCSGRCVDKLTLSSLVLLRSARYCEMKVKMEGNFKRIVKRVGTILKDVESKKNMLR